MTQDAWRCKQEKYSEVQLTRKIPKTRFSNIRIPNNMKSYSHCPAAKSKIITLCNEWIETEIHLFHQALRKESLKVPVGNLWGMARDGERPDN